MATVSDRDIKFRPPELFERLAKGESLAIEQRGVPVAVLNPIENSREEPVEDVIAAIKKFRSQYRLRGLSIHEMIEEARR